MNWFKNIKISSKLIISFNTIAIITIIGIFLIYNNSASVNQKILNKSEAIIDLEAKIVDHIEWSKALLETIITNNKFTKEKNPERCALGKWYNSNQKPENVSLELWTTLKSEHEKLHSDADKITNMLHNGVSTQEVLNYYMKSTNRILANVNGNIIGIKEKLIIEAEEAHKELQTNKTFTIFISLLIILLGTITTTFIIKDLNKPLTKVIDRIKHLQNVCIKSLSTALDKMALGDLTVKVEKSTQPLKLDRKDEIGNLAQMVDELIYTVQGEIDSYEVVRQNIKNLSAKTIEFVEYTKEGNVHDTRDVQGLKGEYKKIIEGLNDVLEEINKPTGIGISSLVELSNGNLTHRITEEFKGDFNTIKETINQLADSFEHIVTKITDAVQIMASASNQISSNADELSAGSQDQSSRTSEVAMAVQQMIATIADTTQNVLRTNESAKESVKLVAEGEQIIQSTIDGMRKIEEVVGNSSRIITELGESSSQISEIVQVINDIADQTNLLALNAAIEAARAGEQGRGFAVVADEVRKLAERTTKATNEIEGMITKIQTDSQNAVAAINKGNEEVNKGVKQATKAGQSMSNIADSYQNVLEISNQVAAASEEQSATVEEIGRSIKGIDTVAQESATGVQQVAGAATDLSQLTENLQSLIAQFKIKKLSNTEYYTVEKELV